MKICDKCKKEFSAQSNLSRHLRQIHGEPPKHSHSLICPLCDDSLTREKYFLDHLRHNHDLTIDERQLYFNTEEEFYKWKILMEKSTASYYRKDRSKKDSKQKMMYFTCNRSGSYSPKQERKRRLRAQGSRKINRTCPAKLIVTKNNVSGQLSVYFIPTHVGHETELKHLNLHKEDRIKIAKKLEMGVDRNQLLHKIRESLGSTSPQRLHLLTVKDLRNIKDRCSSTNVNREQSDEEQQQQPQQMQIQLLLQSQQQQVEASDHQIFTAVPTSEMEVQIDGEISMEDDASIFFDQSNDGHTEDRARLVENILKKIDKVDIDTLTNINEVINNAEQKPKCYVDMGIPITSPHQRRNQASPPKASKSTSKSLSSNGTRLRKILPKPTETIILQPATTTESSLGETSGDTQIANLPTTNGINDDNGNSNEAPCFQLNESSADSGIVRISKICYIIQASK